MGQSNISHPPPPHFLPPEVIKVQDLARGFSAKLMSSGFSAIYKWSRLTDYSEISKALLEFIWDVLHSVPILFGTESRCGAKFETPRGSRIGHVSEWGKFHLQINYLAQSSSPCSIRMLRSLAVITLLINLIVCLRAGRTNPKCCAFLPSQQLQLHLCWISRLQPWVPSGDGVCVCVCPSSLLAGACHAATTPPPSPFSCDRVLQPCRFNFCAGITENVHMCIWSFHSVLVRK